MFNDGVKIQFSDKHDYYISAYKYVTKDDTHFVESVGHPNLKEVDSPRTKACMASNRRRSAEKLNESTDSSAAKKSKEEDGKAKPRGVWNQKLQNIDVADFVIKQNISTKMQLYAEANKRKIEGECDLAVYLFSRSEKYLAELIRKAWMLHGAEKQLTEDGKTPLVRMEEALNGDFVVEGCEWMKCALEILTWNKIKRSDFSSAMSNAMRRGRQKFQNVIIIGRSNCAKTFLLKPLKNIFGERLFENPSNDKYGWQGVQNAQVICLQDFRYSKEMIVWKDFLLLLEGETVKLPTPKNHFAEDIVIDSTNDVPIFSTSSGRIEYSRFSPDYEVETEMMDSRWNIIRFTHTIKRDDQKNIEPCKRCFAELIMS